MCKLVLKEIKFLGLLQISFRHTGPWGDHLALEFNDLSISIAAEKDLVWKIWTENSRLGRAGGVYLFKCYASAEAYERRHRRLLAEIGASEISSEIFEVNILLSLQSPER